MFSRGGFEHFRPQQRILREKLAQLWLKQKGNGQRSNDYFIQKQPKAYEFRMRTLEHEACKIVVELTCFTLSQGL